ncbi:hypothetical protein F4678DRAFT_413951 [Xylaria arbuscula]|nr:hypothetical protein F4678DRAFT_413951 [Xylaria arbuscula]
MIEPPPSYAPPVKDEGVSSHRRITPLRKLQKQASPEPEWVNCQFCKKQSTIRRVSEPSDEAKCITVCCCSLGIFISFLPSAANWLEKIDVHCASCGKHIASIPPDGEVEIVRVSERPQLPSAK